MSIFQTIQLQRSAGCKRFFAIVFLAVVCSLVFLQHTDAATTVTKTSVPKNVATKTATTKKAAVKKAAVPKKVVPTQKLEVSGWIPYWRAATGTADTLTHLDVFTELSPFGYTVKRDGTLADTAKLSQQPWISFFAAAKEKQVKIIPSVTWGSGSTIDSILRSKTTRATHIASIVSAVNSQNFDGIDIDYEGKLAETKVYFSAFIKELKTALGKNKILSCTIEARTPLTSRYDTLPKNIEYANDFAVLGKYCDRVRIMTYDQETIDLRLNEVADGPYAPIADPEWVTKVVNLTAQSIPRNKIIVGIATYGYEYKVRPLSESGYSYNILWSFNPRYGRDLAASMNITPERDRAGELSFIYYATSTMSNILNAGTDTPTTNNPLQAITAVDISRAIAASSTVFAKSSFNYVVWSDAASVADKMALAKKLGVRGVAIFKIDGGYDPRLWDILKGGR